MRIANVDDLDRVKRSGKAGLLLGMQNSEHFDDISDVDTFWAAGQRVSQLTHNHSNRLGSGGMARFDNGLTEYGAAFRTAFGIDGLIHPRRVFDITQGLIRRGYSDAHVRAVLGLNFKRLLGETWHRDIRHSKAFALEFVSVPRVG